MIVLSKLSFIGPLTVSIPQCVIDDVASGLGVLPTLENILSFEGDPPVINPPYTIEDQRLIARFLNPNTMIKWKRSSLARAFTFTYKIIHHNIKPVISREILQYPTPDNPECISPAIAFGLYRSDLTHLPHDITEDSLRDAILFAIQDTRILDQLYKEVITRERSRMIAILLHNSQRESLDLGLIRILCEVDSLSDDFISSREMAIALAARNFKIDISRSLSPTAEYISIRSGNLVPIDLRMAEIYNVNMHAYSLRSVFSPSFPKCIYGTKLIDEHAKRNDIRGITKYEDLCDRYTEMSFYKGLRHGVTSFQTEIGMDDARTASDISLISYGKNGIYVLHSVEDLIQMFTYYGAFQYGEENYFKLREVLTLAHTAKLISFGSITANRRDKKAWSELHVIIEKIKNNISSLDTIMNKFILSACGCENEAETYLHKIFSISMRMKGWYGSMNNYSALPLYNLIKYSNKKSIAYTGEAIGELLIMKDPCGILELPLLRMYEGEIVRSLSYEQGTTIRERLLIVQHRKSLFSCIRMSSNWMLATSHTYLKAMGRPLPFKLEDCVTSA